MKLEQLDRQYVLNTYNRSYINFKKGKNATLWDNNNKEYIDFTSGIGVVSVGHGNKTVSDEIYKQIQNVTHVSNLYVIEPQSLLAQKIVNLSGFDMQCFFGNSGAEANEAAIKVARKYGQKKYNGKRYKVITLENSFHGRTIATSKATGQKSIHKKDFSPYPDGFSFNSNIKKVYDSIDDKTVAVMIELIQGEGGILQFEIEEIQKLAKYLKEKDILFIIDEVQTGIYRTGEFLASNLYNIEPDIVTLAKGVSGGVPIGIMMTKHKDIFEQGDHGSTFGGNYLSCVAGLKVCEILEEHKVNGLLDNTINYFHQSLNTLFENHRDKFDCILGVGLMQGLRLIDENQLKTIIVSALEEGIMVLKSGKNILRFLPPLTISIAEIDEGFRKLDLALKGLKNEY